MNTELRVGSTVEMLTTDGPEIMQIVEIKKQTLYVCSLEEARIAKESGRVPILRGFNSRFVLRGVPNVAE